MFSMTELGTTRWWEKKYIISRRITNMAQFFKFTARIDDIYPNLRIMTSSGENRALKDFKINLPTQRLQRGLFISYKMGNNGLVVCRVSGTASQVLDMARNFSIYRKNVKFVGGTEYVHSSIQTKV